MRTNFREPHVKTLREQPFESICVSIVGNEFGPREVVHDLGKRVWVWSDYSEHWPASVVPVGDGLTNGYNNDGTRLISVPEHMCYFMSEAEAEEIAACMAIDEAMLANAF